METAEAFCDSKLLHLRSVVLVSPHFFSNQSGSLEDHLHFAILTLATWEAEATMTQVSRGGVLEVRRFHVAVSWRSTFEITPLYAVLRMGILHAWSLNGLMR